MLDHQGRQLLRSKEQAQNIIWDRSCELYDVWGGREEKNAPWGLYRSGFILSSLHFCLLFLAGEDELNYELIQKESYSLGEEG